MRQQAVTALKTMTDLGYQITIRKIEEDEYRATIEPARTYGTGKSPELAVRSLLNSVGKRLQPVAS